MDYGSRGIYGYNPTKDQVVDLQKTRASNKNALQGYLLELYGETDGLYDNVPTIRVSCTSK